MINLNALQKLEDAINYQPCGFCGREHRVRLASTSAAINAAQRLEKSSTLQFPTGDSISLWFDSGSCEEFKQAVTAFTTAQSSSLISLPLDII